MPKLIIAQIKGKHDASIGRTLKRQMEHKLNGGFQTLFKEAHAFQKHVQEPER